jgi:hypothetical protein
MRLRGRLIEALLIGMASTLACREPTKPIPASMNVDVEQTAVTAFRSLGFGAFRVDAALTNTGNSTIRVLSCAPTVEREVQPGRWERLPEPYCALASAPPLELQPGAAVARHETIVNTGAIPSAPTGTVTGRYRLIYRYAAAGAENLAAEARSGAFDVIE